VASLYVYALTDLPLDTWVDVERRIESIPVEGVFAICERRPTSPSISEAELRRQHAIVLRVANSVPAALPARFGSLVDDAELARMLCDRREIIRIALDRVRGHVQMTVRIAIEESKTSRPVSSPGSGRAYLQARLQQASPQVPPRARIVLEAVAPLVADERRSASAAGMVTVYQLVSRAKVQEYTAELERARIAGMRVTGPWPAFAFVPDLWT
jgi:hypothetical protein